MKKAAIIISLFFLSLSTFAQVISRPPIDITPVCRPLAISNQSIIYDTNYSNCVIYITNTTISNGATVNIIAQDSVVIESGFSTELGTNVTIEVTDGSNSSGNLLINKVSANNNDDEENNTPSSIEYLDAESEMISIKVYSLTGIVLYYSETNYDIYSIGLSDNVYIIEKRFNNGTAVREKVIIRKS